MEGVSSAGTTADTKVLLVVDDSQTIRRAVELVFTATEYQVVSIASAAEAVVRAPDLQPVLALVDADMPGVNGYELSRRLKSDPRTAELPILLMCAEEGLDREAIDAAEVDGHVTKPFRSRDLLDVVKMMTGALVTSEGPRSFEERLELYRLEQQAKDRRSDPEVRSVSRAGAAPRGVSQAPRPDEGLELDFQVEAPAPKPAGRKPPPAAPPVVGQAPAPAPVAAPIVPAAPTPEPVAAPILEAAPASGPTSGLAPTLPPPPAPPESPAEVPVVAEPAPVAAAASVDLDEGSLEAPLRPVWPKVVLLLAAVGAVVAYMLLSR